MITGYDPAGTDPETGDQIPGAQRFTFSGGVFTDTVRNVSYQITVDANKIMLYTFEDVQKDHWIDVRWEEDPPQESVVITKTWDDDGNARQDRPNGIVVHLISADGNPITTDNKTTLVTGTDPNINGSTEWVKNGDNWTYTFGNIVDGATFSVYEEAVSDYSCPNVGPENAQTITQYTEVKDPETNVVIARIYNVTITNTLKTGELEFTKVGEQVGSDEYSALAGAVFTLYTDELCNHPLTKTVGEDEVTVTATSGTDGIVNFSDVLCGIYYMKETTSPGDYATNNSVYKVTIHENKADSTIVVVTPDPDGDGILIAPTATTCTSEFSRTRWASERASSRARCSSCTDRTTSMKTERSTVRQHR